MHPRALPLPLLAILAACGPAEQKPAVAPAGTATPSATAVATAAPTASATATADKTPPRPAKPVLRFWDYDGPAEGPAITGKRAWTAVPTGEATDRNRHVFISVEDFLRTDGKNNFWSTHFNDLSVPIAMGANLSPPAALKKGDPILADSSNDSALARVVSVEGDTIKTKYVFGDLVGDLDVIKSEVLLLDGTLRLGTPVAFKSGAAWSVGRLIAKNAQDAWIALEYSDNQPYAKVKAADVRALDVAKVLKVGDKCIADYPMVTRNELAPGKITKVIEDGLFYEVKLDKGSTWTVPFHHISAPL